MPTVERKRIDVDDLEGWRETARLGIAAEESATEAFPQVPQQGRGSGFAAPVNAILKSLKYLWLSALSDHYGPTENRLLHAVVRRGIALSNDFPDFTRLRWEHDYLLMTLAILGSFPQSRDVAMTIGRHASDDKSSYSLLARLIAAEVLGHKNVSQTLLQTLQSVGIDTAYAVPSKRLIKFFIARDAVTFSQVAQSEIDKHWTMTSSARAILETKENVVVIDSIKKGINWLWPWPEAALMKLMIAAGRRVSVSSSWIPTAILKT